MLGHYKKDSSMNTHVAIQFLCRQSCVHPATQDQGRDAPEWGRRFEYQCLGGKGWRQWDVTMGSIQAGNRGPSTPKPKHVVIRLTGSRVKDHEGNLTFLHHQKHCYFRCFSLMICPTFYIECCTDLNPRFQRHFKLYLCF